MKSPFIPPYVPQRPVASGNRENPLRKSAQNVPSFAGMLQAAEAKRDVEYPLHISAHAESRMRERGVRMTRDDWQTIGEAVKKAESKGSKDTYVVYGQAGFVVSIQNRTVVTTMVEHDAPVVTNVDSVVVVPRLDR